MLIFKDVLYNYKVVLKHLLSVLALALMPAVLIFGQISSSVSEVTFPLTVIKTQSSAALWVKNNEANAVMVSGFSLSNAVKPSDTLFTIPAEDSFQVQINFTPDQNITYNTFLLFMTQDSTSAVILKVTGSGTTGDNFQSTTFDKWDADLKSALTALVSGHNSLGYNTSRDRMFENIDKQPGDTIECVYTGRKVQAATRTIAQNQGFNTEHSWPQSTFSQNEPMRSDIYHLYPTDDAANNQRSNYPFDMVVSNVTWQVGGSKLGNNSIGQTTFEPRDIHKGNVARSMLYFILRYPTNYGNYLTQRQEEVYRSWNVFDTVDAKERARNNGIAFYQLKRNPLIDHPEFVDRIYSFVSNTTRPVFSKMSAAPYYLNFDTTSVGDSTILYFTIVNSGTKILNLLTRTTGTEIFTILNLPFQVMPNSMVQVAVSFAPPAAGNYQADFLIQSDGGEFMFTVTGIGDWLTDFKDNNNFKPDQYRLLQNYPNPFNPETLIGFSVPNNLHQERVRLAVYDILGNLVSVLADGILPPGDHSVRFDGTSLSGGVYFYTMTAGSFKETKKLVLVK